MIKEVNLNKINYDGIKHAIDSINDKNELFLKLKKNENLNIYQDDYIDIWIGMGYQSDIGKNHNWGAYANICFYSMRSWLLTGYVESIIDSTIDNIDESMNIALNKCINTLEKYQ